jgi:transposase
VAYATDLTDARWRLVRDLFDPPGRRGAPARIPVLIDHLGLPVAARVGWSGAFRAATRVTVTTEGWRRPDKPKGFQPIRPRWKVEDCSAQLGRRRLSRSYEATTESLGVAEVGTGQLARIVERGPSPPTATQREGGGLRQAAHPG